MGLMNFLDNLAADRRRQRLDALQQKRLELLAEHASAVEAGDDTAAERAWQRIEKIDAEIRAAEAALAAQQRQERDKAAQEAEQDLARRHAERNAAQSKLVDEATRFDELLGEVAAQWATVAAAAEHAHRCCVAVGGALDRELTPLAIWRRCWVRFGQRVPYEVPSGAPASKTIAPVAETLAKYRTAPVAQVNA